MSPIQSRRNAAGGKAHSPAAVPPAASPAPSCPPRCRRQRSLQYFTSSHTFRKGQGRWEFYARRSVTSQPPGRPTAPLAPAPFPTSFATRTACTCWSQGICAISSIADGQTDCKQRKKGGLNTTAQGRRHRHRLRVATRAPPTYDTNFRGQVALAEGLVGLSRPFFCENWEWQCPVKGADGWQTHGNIVVSNWRQQLGCKAGRSPHSWQLGTLRCAALGPPPAMPLAIESRTQEVKPFMKV